MSCLQYLNYNISPCSNMNLCCRTVFNRKSKLFSVYCRFLTSTEQLCMDLLSFFFLMTNFTISFFLHTPSCSSGFCNAGLHARKMKNYALLAVISKTTYGKPANCC